MNLAQHIRDHLVLNVRSDPETLLHTELLDMPDTGGTNTDHDLRYWSIATAQTGLTGSKTLTDNTFISFGTGGDSQLYYDGTNLIINPKVVGTGYLSVLGDVNATGTLGAGVGTLTSLNLTADTNQIVLNSDGGVAATTLTGSAATSAKVITFPNFTGTLYISGGTDVAVADGGTNLSSYTTGAILYASASTTLAGLLDVAAGSYLRSGGTSTAPLWSTLILPNSITDTYVVCATGTNTYGSDAGLTYNDSTDLLTVTDSLTISDGTVTTDGLTLTGKISMTSIKGASSTSGSTGSAVTLNLGSGGDGSAGNGGQGGNLALNLGGGGTGTKTSTTVIGGAASDFIVDGSDGGSATGSGTCTLATSGTGSDITFNVGGGGISSNSNTASTGGNAGGYTFNSATGGSSTASGTIHIGGTGSFLNYYGGAGGPAGYGSDAQTAGTGGAFSVSSGMGGAATGGTVASAGDGGIISFTTASGGNAVSGSSSNTGGDGGDLNLIAGLGGTGATANGVNGRITFVSGITEIARFDNTAGLVGRFGIGIAPTAMLTLKAGTATAGTAPLKFTSGPLTTAAVAGQIEYLSAKFYIRGTEGLAFGASTEYINSANADYLDLHSTKDTRITCGANYTLTLATSVFDDLQFQVAYAKVTPNNLLPSWEVFTTNTSEYAFAIDEEVDTAANELPHWWKEGTVGNAHLHITTKGVPAQEQKAQFTVTFAYADTNEVWVEAPLTAELTIPISTTALTNFYLDLGDLTLTNYLLGAQIKCRIKRVAKSAGGTEYVGDIFITQAGIHLEKIRMGSRNELTS